MMVHKTNKMPQCPQTLYLLRVWSVNETKFMTNYICYRLKFDVQTHTLCTHTQYMWCVVNSFVDLGKKLLNTPGVKALFSERFNQDPLESFFGKHQRGGYRYNPTVKDFIYGTQSLRIQGSLVRDPKRGNCRKRHQDKPSDVIDNTPLPKRKRYSGSRK